MAYLLANIPPIEVWVRKEFLTDFSGGEGEYLKGNWVTVKSIPNQALYFETYIWEWGALYDKLPLHAFVWKTDVEEFYTLGSLQLWDCLSYNISVITKQSIRNSRCEVLMKTDKRQPGTYLFTVDTCHSEPNEPNTGWSETPNEHKSYNIIRLDNGQFAAQPNNRILWKNQSLTGEPPSGRPPFRFSTRTWLCESEDSWSSGDGYNYES